MVGMRLVGTRRARRTEERAAVGDRWCLPLPLLTERHHIGSILTIESVDSLIKGLEAE